MNNSLTPLSSCESKMNTTKNRNDSAVRMAPLETSAGIRLLVLDIDGTIVDESNRIGDSVSIGSHSVIEHHVIVGHAVRIHSNVFVPEYTVLEDSCWIGPNAVLTNARYPCSPDAKKTLQGPVLKRHSKIGANVTILPGVVIGARALVGAGSVVVNDVPDGKVVVGNPARIIGDVKDYAEYRDRDDSTR